MLLYHWQLQKPEFVHIRHATKKALVEKQEAERTQFLGVERRIKVDLMKILK